MSGSSRARLLLKNAKQIVTVGGGSKPKLGRAMGQVDVLENHSMLVDYAGNIVSLVPAGVETESLHRATGDIKRVVDCGGKVVMPGFVDGHTHAVFDGDRSHEHAMKLAGATYEEVHAAGGGINFTVRATRAASEDRLLGLLLGRLDAMMRSGTTTCEIKSGYGLEWETELKMLKVVKQAQGLHRMATRASFLVHAVPKGTTSAAVADKVISSQLPKLRALVDAGEVSADFVDVFCEKGFFTPADTSRILLAGKALGFEASFHGDELSDLGCGLLARDVGARAVSHLEMLSKAGVAAMAAGGVHAVLLPTTAHLLRLPSPPARALIDAGAPVALATDFNPNAYCLDMPTAMNLACVHFRMTMAEALVAATINAASALGVASTVGSLELGKRGDCFVLDAPSWEHVVYQMRPPIAEVFKGGLSVAGADGSSSRLSAQERGAQAAAVGAAFTARQAAAAAAPKKWDLSSLAAGIPTDPLPPKAALDHGVPHAPRRPIKLTQAVREQALKNALRYFPPSTHAELLPEFSAELEKFGHIYMHRFRPVDHPMKAHPLSHYPANTTAGAALMHMVMNNLDPAVAQFPHELITYGGNGAAFSNWAQYRLTMQYLAAMGEEQTLALYSGHPMGLFPSHRDAPRCVVTNGMVIPNYSGRDDYEEMYATGVSQYGQMTAGSFCYIGPQGIVHGTTLTLLNAGRKYLGTADDLKGKLFITAGLGGMSGAQAKAAVVCGAVVIVAEVSGEAVDKRHSQGWVLDKSASLDECLAMAAAAVRERRGASIAYHGNVVDLWERLAADARAGTGVVPELGSDQTSCHNPFAGGYYPAGLTYAESQAMMADDPEAFKVHVQASLRRQVAAINSLTEGAGKSSGRMRFFDYGNSFLLEASRAGADVLDAKAKALEAAAARGTAAESGKKAAPPTFR